MAIVAAIFLSPGSLLLASTNDAFASRINVAGTNLTLFGANTNTTKQAGEPNHAGNGILTSAVTVDATSGQTLQIAVDGFDGDFGEITLHIKPLILRLVVPVRLPDGSFRFTLDTLPGMTNEIQISSDLHY